uniref:PRA1 family protein n=1 Tax=Meloidogyne incognita TaxID=6306 RepID=A0A914LZ09_MELIC
MVTTRFASRKLLSINKLNSPNQQFIKWEKVLYKHQPFPDNYTDDALFLDQLRTNVIFEFCRLEFCGSKTILLINLIICFILLSLITFYRCFYIYWQTLFTIFTFGYAFTPVIRTLTTTISTDTIWASAIILFFVSLLVHDYGMDFAPMRVF